MGSNAADSENAAFKRLTRRGISPALAQCPRRLMESARNRPAETAAASYPTIAATATALPPHTITREDVKVYMGRVFDIPDRRLEAMMSIVDNAQVHNRHAIFPLDYTIEPRPLSQTNNEYIAHAVNGTGLRRRGHGPGTRRRLLEGRTRRKCPDYRRGAALAHLSAQGHFAGQPDFLDPFWRRRGGRGGQRKTNAGTEDSRYGNLYVSGFAGRHGI